MTKTAEALRTEMLALLASNIEAAEKAIRLEATQFHVLTNKDGTLFVGESVGVLRFLSPLDTNVTMIGNGLASARRAAGRWNSQLTETQIEAGCTVEAMEYRKAMRLFIQTQRGLQAQLAIV